MFHFRCSLIPFFSLAILLSTIRTHAQWDPSWDDRHGVVATRTSGYQLPLEPFQGPDFFDPISMQWWYDYYPDDAGVFPGYSKLYMYWRATLGRSAAQIQADAANAKAAYPGETIWWAMSNEPNDLGQANQSATDFAAIYLHHHKNLKIGDPDCRIIGPGLLNWTFVSTSVWQAGKYWYEEFREAWYNNPEARAYSEDNYGVSYPPQDGFNLHSYDLRGVHGTPYAPMSSEWCAEQIELCHADILAYPEVFAKEIWLTEFGGLRAANMNENVQHSSGLVAWMRRQPYMKRWFWFTIHSDRYWKDTRPSRLELLDTEGMPTFLGTVAGRLARMPREDDLAVFPETHPFSGLAVYARPGTAPSTRMTDNRDGHLKFGLVQGTAYQTGEMRGGTIMVPGPVRHLTFDYSTNYDNSSVILTLDTDKQQNVWSADLFGTNDGHVELELPENSYNVSFSLLVRNGFSFPYATDEWQGTIRNLIVYYTPRPAASVEIW